MLKRKKQRKYLAKRCRELRRQLHSFCHDGGEEALHKVRVEIKKLKAFSKFTHAEKMPGSLRKIFRKAGVIREAGINDRLLQQFHIPHADLGDTKQLTRQFQSNHRRYDHSIRRACKRMAQGLHPVGSGRTRHWLRRQVDVIGRIMLAPGTDQLHAARKKLKNLLYVSGMLGDQPAIGTDYLDNLQDAIGKWHDLDVATALLASQGRLGKTVFRRIEAQRQEALAAVHSLGKDFTRSAVPSPGRSLPGDR